VSDSSAAVGTSSADDRREQILGIAIEPYTGGGDNWRRGRGSGARASKFARVRA